MNHNESALHRSRYSPHPGTAHASAERDTYDDVEQQRERLARAEPMLSILEQLSFSVMLLNEHRQVVYANPALLRFCESSALEEILGLRIGEVFQCRYSVGHTGGCGTSTPCRTCGVTNSVLAALGDRVDSRECHIHSGDIAHDVPISFGIEALPFSLAGEVFVFVLIDRTASEGLEFRGFAGNGI